MGLRAIQDSRTTLTGRIVDSDSRREECRDDLAPVTHGCVGGGGFSTRLAILPVQSAGITLRQSREHTLVANARNPRRRAERRAWSGIHH